ncbi:putative beta-lysine N-acetyltransferase [Methanofollis fontis]|uniref:Putative beta-lysine N-acetyltransferase n=1 Tax=Methanofollis fontis TaxID=2052832 RepID=A0A483CVF6_9EURY|nr:putative beta-lysine N-acetyltransferase [Methanofollis fontis]TAJ44967.1 putative beta-lysine N-acetyltransferase [Methanofollis fontis]
MPDTVTRIGDSLLQHGPANRRVYLMHLAQGDEGEMPARLISLAQEKGYTKVIARIPAGACDPFYAAGFHLEAAIPGLYGGEEDGCFAALFLDPGRSTDPKVTVERSLLGSGERERSVAIPEGCRIREAGPADADAVADLYAGTFETYPFPIDDPAYLRRAMADHVRFFVAEADDGIVAASSAEIDPEGRNAEMTDLAVRPAWRGRGLSSALLQRMERAARDEGIRTAYTIARAAWYPVNRLFAGAGYRYSGTLINNTQICGRCESMHVWHRRLD